VPDDVGLAVLSDRLLMATILLYAAAVLAYTAEYAFGARGRVDRAARPRVLVAASAADTGADTGVGAGADTGAEAPSNPSFAARAGGAAVALTVLGAVLHVGVLVSRGIAADRVPWGNMYEYTVSVCLVAVLAWLFVLARRSRRASLAADAGVQPVRHLGVFVMLPVVLLLGLAGTVLYTRVAPLVPALDSYWLKIHVTAAVIASGVFMVSFATAAMFLVRSGYDRAVESGRPLRFPATLGPRLPAAATLDRVTFRLIAFAFPVWTFAVIAGAIWAEAAWSRYWAWDPKETWAFITWVVYAAYLHARGTAGWRGRGAAWLAIAGWVTMMIDLFVVNLVISGLHSYAGLQ